MSDSEIIRTRTGRSILRFRAEEAMIAEIYLEANKLDITISQFLRHAISHYLADMKEIRRRGKWTALRILKAQDDWPDEEESLLRDKDIENDRK